MSSSSNSYRFTRASRRDIRPWWYSSSAPDKNKSMQLWNYELRNVDDKQAMILKTTGWATLPGIAGQLYAEFYISNPWTNKYNDSQIAQHFWQSTANQNVVQKHIQDANVIGSSTSWSRRVFVSLDHAGPFGPLSWRLSDRTPTVNSLLIQAYGVRNALPCDCCARSFQKHIGNDTEEPVRRLVPYFECVSLPGCFSNRCGNCMYAESGKSCDYEANKDTVNERWATGRSGADPKQGYRHRRKMSGDQVESLIPSDIARVKTSICMISDHIQSAKVDAEGKYAPWCQGGVSFPAETNKFVVREDYQRLEIQQAAQAAKQDQDN